MERNLLINDGHPEVDKIMPSLHQPIWWDGRFSASVLGRRGEEAARETVVGPLANDRRRR